MESFLSPDQSFGIASICFFVTAVAFWVEKTKLGRKLSGPLCILLIMMTLSNLQIIPHSAPVYGFFYQYLVPATIPLLLMKANLREIFSKAGRVMIAYMIGVVGTVIGGVVAYHLVVLDYEPAKIIGIFVATYVGGSVNFAAVADAVQFTDPSKTSSALAADNIVGATYLLLLTLVSSFNWIRRYFPSQIMEESHRRTIEAPEVKETVALNLEHKAFALALSFGICGLANYLSAKMGVPGYSMLFITVLIVTISNVFPKMLSKLTGNFELGTFFMYLFFAAVGAGTNLKALIYSAPMLALAAATIILVHILVLFPLARLLKIDFAEVIIASNACVLGPPTAAALAASQGWRSLVTPGIMCGVFGYVIANFIGVTLANFLG
ncbi:MAG: hypothetical protein COB36_09170 [Alphaproteobacteria bacterium]|nr:MAG: hypothetical protein COB36_09170 [Alphaproteobacteria bacterium]